MAEVPTKTTEYKRVSVLLEKEQIEYLWRLGLAWRDLPRLSLSAVLRQVIDEYRSEHEEGNDGAGKGH